MADATPSFLTRLKQHHIYRVAVGYGTAIAVLIQVAARAFPYFGWSAAVPAVIIVLIASFPVALVLAWLLVKPASPAGETRWQRRHWKLGAVVTPIVIAAVVVSGIYAFHYAEHHGAGVAAERAVARAAAPVSANTLAPSAATLIPAKSVAVLPFVNMSGDPQKGYFSDGITEEIINALAQVPNLKVAARTSAFAFKGKDEDLREVGEVLGVATVLEGSVQTAGGEVRITAQLIDARSGYHLWSEKYDRKLTNIFAVEDEISKAITDKLQVQLNGGGDQPLVSQKTVNPRAHDFYLRGLSFQAARSVLEAAAAFQQAVTLDPDYALAWGELAQAQALSPQYTPDAVQDAQSRAETTAQHALALNPDTSPAYVALGMVYTNRWQWADANKAFHHALMLTPGDAEAVDQYGQFQQATGQFEPALREIERAQMLDPLAGVNSVTRASILNDMHRYDAALAQIASTLQTHPQLTLAHHYATVLAIDHGRYTEAEKQMRLAAQLSGD
ncbi:MAG: hypothetical protein KGJ04_06435, partial [Gammaproteobacteria bacterium]|nr:hypothetical protein [Gammaproteobacteria bacterium]